MVGKISISTTFPLTGPELSVTLFLLCFVLFICCNLDMAGSPVLPGEVFPFSAGKTILVPDTFMFTGKLTHFTVMFADTNPVQLQVSLKLKNVFQFLSITAHKANLSNWAFQYSHHLCGFCGVCHLPISCISEQRSPRN